jgi:hypothetical protein
MIIVTKLKEDLVGKIFWALMLVNDQENDAVMFEVHSLAFDMHDNYTKWKEFEKAHNRMAIELMNAKHGKKGQLVINQMFLAPNKYDKIENRF